MSEVKTEFRGSSRLTTMTREDMLKSISLARSSYKIERWWKYGQPAIDRIAASLNITKVKETGKVITDLISKHGEDLQVTLDVFPYGIPVIDGVRIDVNLDQRIH